MPILKTEFLIPKGRIEEEVFPDDGEYLQPLQNGTTAIWKTDAVWRLLKRDDGGSVLQASEF